MIKPPEKPLFVDKYLLHKGDQSIYVHNNRTSKYTKQKWTKSWQEINKNTKIMWHLKITLSVTVGSIPKILYNKTLGMLPVQYWQGKVLNTDIRKGDKNENKWAKLPIQDTRRGTAG